MTATHCGNVLGKRTKDIFEKQLVEFFNNSDAILNFEHIAMHCGLSRAIQLF